MANKRDSFLGKVIQAASWNWELESWKLRAQRAEAAIQKVTSLHSPTEIDSVLGGAWCDLCSTVWPCETVSVMALEDY